MWASSSFYDIQNSVSICDVPMFFSSLLSFTGVSFCLELGPYPPKPVKKSPLCKEIPAYEWRHFPLRINTTLHSTYQPLGRYLILLIPPGSDV
jgi:hypothetical protein